MTTPIPEAARVQIIAQLPNNPMDLLTEEQKRRLAEDLADMAERRRLVQP